MIQQLTPALIIGIIVSYFLVLVAISYFTGKDAGNDNFFLAGRKSNWMLVAFGMVGATLSGVTKKRKDKKTRRRKQRGSKKREKEKRMEEEQKKKQYKRNKGIM
eukprot:TRINITY_DN27781_c0_g1_i1.p3 TRINITY_DN27781_c0_g1~~TRINITY_DN27781_c0_g1_i1.p3  ORF type:complete len:104 (-),score=13.38 TRINITY_DN27781_c0_g1_i1:19-330(-)